jgi:hypothetical protein
MRWCRSPGRGVVDEGLVAAPLALHGEFEAGRLEGRRALIIEAAARQ